MKKKDVFFLDILTITFFVCAIVIAGDYLNNRLIRHLEKKNKESVSFVVEQKQPDTAPVFVENTTQPIKAEVTEEKGYEYFDDALFIGDSRTVGLMEYGNLENASFFADSGMTVFGLEEKKLAVAEEGKRSFDEMLTQRKYGKVYLMLGINELGYRFEHICSKYQEILNKIQTEQENAIIYLCANMHVTQAQSCKDEIYNNENINRLNDMIYSLTDGERIFYLDVNELFDDENGNLRADYSSDSFHVYGKYYAEWVNWLCSKAV